VAIGAEPGNFKEWPKRFSAPLVLVDRDAPENCENIYSVRSDESKGMELAIGHLYERGCRRIGCIIHGEPGAGNADIRRESVSGALRKRELPVNDSLIYLADDDEYVEIIGKLLKKDIDALFCPGGNAGIVTAYALSLFNKKVPDEISLIASEHKLFSRYATPPQTAITQDHTALAEIAADIIESCSGHSRPPRRTVLQYSLIIRDSVRCPD
jgi:LacI family transcriptional regulator